MMILFRPCLTLFTLILVLTGCLDADVSITKYRMLLRVGALLVLFCAGLAIWKQIWPTPIVASMRAVACTSALLVLALVLGVIAYEVDGVFYTGLFSAAAGVCVFNIYANLRALKNTEPK